MFKGFTKRVLSMILCIAMVIALLPQIAAPAVAIGVQDIKGKKVDPSTIDGWKTYFGPDVISTEYTGGVWTDKSVFDSMASYLTAAGVNQLQGPTTAVSDQVKAMLQTDPENFLVTMSAIAANQQITGYTTKPTDTMFVLDVSQSMDTQGYVPAMISAANSAIKTLMEGNQHNRIGVVLFSGSSNINSNQGTGSATVLLPLDHYTSSNSAGTFLRYTGSSDTTVYVAQNVKNSAGTTVNSNSGKNTVGGTYTQNGLYQAWLEFSELSAADIVIPEGQPQAGTKRSPVMVLMSDGQPTVGDTTYYNIGNSTVGDGGTPSDYNANRLTFLTQLTAAWVKAKLANKYAIGNSDVKFYTVGLNTATNRYATDLLDPASSTNETVDGWWEDFVDATPNRWGQITLGSGNGGWTGYKLNDSMITSVEQRKYATRYFSAADTAKLADAFAEIAEALTEKTPYVTLVSEGNIGDLDGYVTFDDYLGVLMEVKDVKGLMLGDRIFTGAELARGMSQGDFDKTDNTSSEEKGDELVRTVMERMGITDITVAHSLLRDAWSSGQLSYTSATEYSNFIGWYSDANGKYLGHWEEADGYQGVGAPENTKYINKSYGYLGVESSLSHDSDMMHVVVMVRTEIATGDQTVIYKIPASLIPTVQYLVTLDGVDASKPKSVTRQAASPLRLLFEVGLRSDINTVNLETKAAEYVANGGHIHENDDGTYTFYTNRWGDGDGGEVNYDLPLTHVATESHFHPAEDNVRYYFTDDTAVCSDASGTLYTGSTAPTGKGYYYARKYYQVVDGTAKQITEYVPLAEVTVAHAARGSSGWYIPAGTPQQLTRFAVLKTGNNPTGTLEYSWNPVVLHDAAGYNSYAFLGNNGTFTVAPAQGIALSKTVTETAQGAPTTFEFKVKLSQAAPDLAVTDADGNVLTGVATVNGTEITVQLQAGQTVYLTGIPTGTTYEVTEEQTRYYAASSTNANGDVKAHTINAVDFTNTPKGYGDLIISKDVTHPYDVVPEALTQKQFTIEVTLSGTEVAGKSFRAEGLNGVTSVTTDAGGKFTMKLRDGESITLKDLPEGTAFVAIEQLDSANDKGFALVRANSVLAGQVEKDQTAQIHVVNDYAPSEPVASITVTGAKTVDDKTGTFDWTGKSFAFKLEQYHPETGTYTQLGETVTVSQQGGTYTFADALELNAIGTYHYKVSEIIPGENDRLEGMSYDASAGRFVVVVTDNDVDGHLEFEIRDYATNDVINGSNGEFTFTKNFVNTHTTDATFVEFTVDKTITDPHGIGTTEAGYLFGLFEVNGQTVAQTPAYTMRTVLQEGTQDGKATFHIPLTKVGSTTYVLREIAPAANEKLPGMVYDATEYTVTVTAAAQGGKLVPSVAFQKAGVAVTENELVFNNEMKLNPTSVQWPVTKVMTGDTLSETEEFEFTLTETDGSFVTVKAGGVTETVTITGAGTKSFSKIDYTKVGTYYYVISETAGTRKGMTYDPTVYHLTVNVTVDGDDLKADTTIAKLGGGTANSVEFTNRYDITGSVSALITGAKELAGRTMRTGEFTFELKKGGTLVDTATNLVDGSFSFRELSYTSADIGIHTYTVTEKQPVGAVNNKYEGVTYSTKEYTVTVTVSDNGQGGLNIVIDGVENGTITFQNTYTTGSTTVNLTGTKTWYNEDTKQPIALSGDEFTFKLYKSNADFSVQGDEVTSVQNGAGGRISISRTYNQAGEYFYILREDVGTDETTAYDTSRYLIRVLIVDDGKGNLSSVVTMTKDGETVNTVDFSNVYTPKPVSVTIRGEKHLTGRDIVKGEFIFELWDKAAGKLLATTENVGNTSNPFDIFEFDAIEYENTGTYAYKIVERIPSGHINYVYNGVTYDNTEHDVTVTVTDDEGILKAQVDYPNTGLKFYNTYRGADTHFSITGEKRYNKTMEAGMFTFEMVDEAGVHVATATNDANGYFTFTNIPLVAVNEEGYVFFIQEKIPEGAVNYKKDGITYSQEKFKVTVKVTDDTTLGQLVASAPEVANGPIVFENTYSVEPIQATIRAVKKLEGRDLKPGEFEFELYEGNDRKQITTNKADGTIEFQSIEYSAAGDYEYTIREVVKNVDGITCDPEPHAVLVEVTDNGDGTLSAEVIYDGGSAIFENTYKITGDTQFTVGGTKVLNGRDMTTEDVFTFELRDSTGAVIKTVNAQNGQFLFADVKLDKLGVHTFTVNEKVPAGATDRILDGITYSSLVYDVTVEVTDNGKGGMTAGAPVVSYRGVDVATMIFTNTYKITGGTTTDIVGVKTLNGNKELKPGMYTFELYAGTDTNAEPIASVTNGESGAIVFKDIPVNTLGKHTFTVVEKSPAGGKLDGVTYSDLIYTVTVDVKDNLKGGMTAGTPKYFLGSVEKDEMKFINTYAVEGELPVRIQGKKTLTGGKKLTANAFTFELYEGAAVAGTPVAQVQNAQDGTFGFDLSFNAPGTYIYTVRELAPEGYEADGVRYSELAYQVTVQVDDDGKGGMTVKAPAYELVTAQGNKAVELVEFVNEYTPEDVPFVLEINKIVKINSGEGVSPKGFKFQVWHEGEAVAELESDANGKAKLDLVAGPEDIGSVVELKVTEVNTKIKGVTYSKVEHDIRIAIGQNDDGTIGLDFTVNGQPADQLQVEFVNTYDAAETPNTGDDFSVGLFVALMAISAMGLAALLLAKKKKSANS